MTTKQRNFWLAALGVAGALYIAPSFFGPYSLIRFGPPIRQQPAPKKDATPPPAPVAATPAIDPALDKFVGVWEGYAPVSPNICTVKIEIRHKDGDPAHLAGFPTVNCLPMAIPSPMDKRAPQDMLSRLSPLSAVLTGAPANGSLQFTVDKVIGKSAEGCALTSFTITPFGADQVSAEWQETPCQGGQLLLRKGRG